MLRSRAPRGECGLIPYPGCDTHARAIAVLDVTRYVPTLLWPGIGAPATAASWLWSAAAAEAEDCAPADPETLVPETLVPGT
jgi:hypothetical protein